MSNALRFLSADGVEKAKSGHPGMPLGMADVASVLFGEFLQFNPEDPLWPNRDRFVLSAGHGSMLLYSLLHLTGYKDMPLEALKNFRTLHSPTAGHPEYGHGGGIETTTGPLGQGFANAVGMALAERSLAAEFGAPLVDHTTYVIAGDGCLMEGLSEEALSFAGHQGLHKLIVFFDDNHITIDGPTTLSTSTDHLARFEASAWHTDRIDGHDYEAIKKAILRAKETKKPSLIACRTLIGKGAPTKAGTHNVHGSPLGQAEINTMRKDLGWHYGPFEVPEEAYALWQKAAHRGKKTHEAWLQHLENTPKDVHLSFLRRMKKELPQNWQEKTRLHFETIYDKKPVATRKSSEIALTALFHGVPELLGGSADLTPSNNTLVAGMENVNAQVPQGHYIRYGIREHAMAAIMNGIAVHGGYVPYGGTFLTFSDYCRPAIRLSALMGIRVIYVMTHDSIGLGEDGPTHQPVEHLMSLRLIPGLDVFRPADTVETFECWELALLNEGPSLLALSRQTLPVLRDTLQKENKSARGGYVLREPSQERDLTLIATGSEVSLALEVADLLTKDNIHAAVVSMPSLSRFLKQESSYQKSVLGTKHRVSIEAGVTRGWERIVGEEGLSFGVDTFGASAPLEEVYTHFGLTASILHEKILKNKRGNTK